MVTANTNLEENKLSYQLRIKSAILLDEIASATDNFFLSHPDKVENSDWTNFIDRIIDLINSKRN